MRNRCDAEEAGGEEIFFWKAIRLLLHFSNLVLMFECVLRD